jgi:hypothetical protein
MHATQHRPSRLPLGLKAVGCYFILIVVIDLLLPLLLSSPRYRELEDRTSAQKAVASARTVALDVLYLACAVGLFRRRAWARKLGLFVLAVGTFYAAYAFGWGFANGKPSAAVLVMSFGVMGGWNAIWFCLLYRQSSVQALSRNDNGGGTHNGVGSL